MFDQFQESFREEAFELLSRLEDRLLWLEQNPSPGPDQDSAVSGVFRIVHTIKGSAGMFGFDTISEFTHDLENLLDAVRSGEVAISSDVIDITLSAKDLIRSLLDELPTTPLPEEGSRLLERLSSLMSHEPSRETGEQAPPVEEIGLDEAEQDLADSGEAPASPEDSQGSKDTRAQSQESGVRRSYHIRFSPPPELFQNGSNPIPVLAELGELGDCTAVPFRGDIPPLSDLQFDRCYVSWDIFLTTTATDDDIRDVFLFIPGEETLKIRLLDEITQDEPGEYRRLGQIMVDRGLIDSSTVEELVGSQRRLGQLLIDQGVPEQEIESALHEQEYVRRSREQAEAEMATQSIRVKSERLDEMVNLVGELVTLQARLGQISSTGASSELLSVVENFERLIDDLRDRTMAIRMVPISTVFTRLRRLVRDVSRSLNKEIEFVATGGETELDKTVIEGLSDPLVHIIRNSVDHGVETPEVRESHGKPRAGNIYLSAQHVGVNVQIRISDDGAGLNREKIKARAIERGLVPESAELSDAETDQLIMQPGFSTAEAVTSLSGRGVGMDVVKRELDRIGGTVTVESEPGHGSTFVLSIPLTLAIIDGLLVRVGEDRFVIPLAPVEACMELDVNQDLHSVRFREQMLPVIDLHRVFRIEGDTNERRQIVVATTDLGPIGFVVDAVIGNHQTVIKNLGALYNSIREVSGATILGDGSVALILDATRLAEKYRDECGSSD